MMKKCLAVVAGLLFGVALMSSGAWAQDFTIKYAVSSPPDSFHQAYADKFKELCEKYSGGKIKVNVYGGAQLGSEEDNVQGMFHEHDSDDDPGSQQPDPDGQGGGLS